MDKVSVDKLMYKKICSYIIVALVCMGSHIFDVSAYGARVDAVRLGSHDAEHIRLVLDISKNVDYKAFTLANPYRVVLDLPEIKWPKGIPSPPRPNLISGIRYGLFAPGQSRLVLDMNAPISIVDDFLIPPSAGFGHRLVLDLRKISRDDFEQARAQNKAVADARSAIAPPRVPLPPSEVMPFMRPQINKPVIVLDPGHGGVDPGAHGAYVQEKNIVFTYAQELAAVLRKSGKYHVHMTRTRDIYISLAERVAFARRRNASLFISIHADAIARKNVRGLSVYTLSEKASDAVAAALARKENRADIIAGIDFEEQPKEVANILIDLAQRETKNLSARFANLVIKNADGATEILERPHRFAGFRVLKAPDIPSVLIELGFLTNLRDEKQLTSKRWRRKISHAMAHAIDNYFTQYVIASASNEKILQFGASQ